MNFLNRSSVFALLLCALMLGGSVDAGPTRYAAFAFSPSTGLWGYGNGFATKEEAIKHAEQECGGRDMITRWCKNAWIALAVSGDGGYGWAWATTAAKARADAVERCLEENAEAKVVLCVSSHR